MLLPLRSDIARKALEADREGVAAHWKMYETWANMDVNGKG
jgi:hypothetical protein